MDQHTVFDRSHNLIAEVAESIYAKIAPCESPLTSGTRFAPPVARASISASENFGRPKFFGNQTTLASAPLIFKAQPSLPRNLMDGSLVVGAFFAGAGAAATGAALAGAALGVGAAASAGAAEASEAATVASASVSNMYKSAPTSTSSSLKPNKKNG